MKKKNLNQLQLKKKTIANFKGKLTGGDLTYTYPTADTCMSVDFCASEQTCQTFDMLCNTEVLCGSQLTECNCTF